MSKLWCNEHRSESLNLIACLVGRLLDPLSRKSCRIVRITDE